MVRGPAAAVNGQRGPGKAFWAIFVRGNHGNCNGEAEISGSGDSCEGRHKETVEPLPPECGRVSRGDCGRTQGTRQWRIAMLYKQEKILQARGDDDMNLDEMLPQLSDAELLFSVESPRLF